MSIHDASVFNVDVTGAGDHIIVPAVPGKIVRVWRIILTGDVSGDGKVKLRFKAGGAFLNGTFFLYRGSGAMLGAEARSWIMTTPGQDVSLNLSGAADVAGSMLAEYI